MEEIMNNVEVMEVESEETHEESNGKSGLLIGTLIVAGVAGAGFGLYKLGKKVYEKIKAKKELESGESCEATDNAKVDFKRVK